MALVSVVLSLTHIIAPSLFISIHLFGLTFTEEAYYSNTIYDWFDCQMCS